MAANFTNRLARESSPYLLQHAHNPVDWYPWGPEAFAEARRRDCPIFLSVGYSTCYWCHVMERESFENPEIAQLLNERFVCIKVDREERPDVDQLYMTAVQLLTRSGGWPMNLFLTPELKPFYGGTYFPPQDAQGRRGFPYIIAAIAKAWDERRAEVQSAGQQLLEALGDYGKPPSADAPITIDAAMIDTLVSQAAVAYDSHHGGFGSAPKFPQETLLDLLLAYCTAHRGTPAAGKLWKMLLHTLDAMARGGIRDQLGGGFHRYSTDAQWLVPHFEIMLYDNALLAPIYAEAGRESRDPWLQSVARETCDFVLRKMADSSGGFYTALDAEVDAHEGAPYLWTAGEIAEVLPAEDAALFGRVYGVSRGPNFADPHHGSGVAERNVLYLPAPLPAAAEAEGMSLAQLEERLTEIRRKLLDARERRKQPGMDTKILTGWNALMVRSLVRCGMALSEPRYLEAAENAARYLLTSHRRADGTVLRTRRAGGSRLGGTLEDYALLALALLSLYRASSEDAWRDAAVAILEQMDERFGGAGAYYSAAAGEADIIVRQQIGVDSPLPSGNGAAALAWLEAGRAEKAAPIISAFAASLEKQGEAMSTLAQAAMLLVGSVGPLEVALRASRVADPALLAQEVVDAALLRVDSQTLLLRVRIREGWHIPSHTAEGGVAATQVIPTGQLEGHVADIHYPPPEAGAYAGEIPIGITLRGEVKEPAEVVLVYQPCSEEACLPVVRKPVRVAT